MTATAERARSAHRPNPALAAVIAAAAAGADLEVLRVMPPDGAAVRLPDGTCWNLFTHRAAGIP